MIRLPKMRLSDLLLMACVPAALAVGVNASGIFPFQPQSTYLIALMGSMPAALVAVSFTELTLRRGIALTRYMLCVSMLVVVIATPFSVEMHRSRMFSNQVAAAAACRILADAEETYRRADHDHDGVLEFALTIRELATPSDGSLALIDRAFADAEGLPATATPKDGYVFKVLTAQGSNGTGGSKSYTKNGDMTEGYALMACPAVYDGTGRDTFLISNNGTIFQSDLGPDTAQIMAQTIEFNPAPIPWGCVE